MENTEDCNPPPDVWRWVSLKISEGNRGGKWTEISRKEIRYFTIAYMSEAPSAKKCVAFRVLFRFAYSVYSQIALE
jgi:hypothetical protein